jgi:phosphatidylserine/phosphatidylglycerophosphate/cardiolipin synthase-like enzyme
MHHKVFIVDEKIVITGSTNPSNNGLTKNDENIIILYDEVVARKYFEEFKKLK